MSVVTRAPHAESCHFAGSYGGMTGIIAANLAAASEIFQFRWAPSDTTKLCVVRKVIVSASVSTTFFAAGVPALCELVKATGWTAAGSGGTAIDPSTFLNRRSSLFSDSEISSGDMRIATTAALGTGTKTLESLASAAIVAGAPITASLMGTVWTPTALINAKDGDGEYPLILEDNEGFVVRATVPATGTWSAAVQVVWHEVSSY